MAILDRFPPGKPMLLILPGSHNKFVSVDREGKITGCLTSISGNCWLPSQTTPLSPSR